MGLVVLTGCGHAGVVNITRCAQQLTGEDRVHALIGGFHLQGPGFDEVINPTVDALTRLAPDALVPSHCTGRKARHRLASTLPDAFITNSVGTVYTFSSPSSK
jgi:7,8-dihydropterin-6-yl-methyl-4-(beta-D-ribofuranosyl)aminobenzene 5'-phosphate synthase